MKVAVLAYPRVMTSAVFGIRELLEVANGYLEREGRRPFHSYVVAAPGAPEPLAGDAVPIERDSEVADIIIVPPSLADIEPGCEDAQIRAWLKVQADHGTTLCSVCAGAFLLADAGLLDHRSATTHWALEERFRRRFPRVHLKTSEMLVDEGDRITAGGVTAYFDLLLHLIGRYAGPSVARKVGGHMLVDRQPRQQNPYRQFLVSYDHGDELVIGVQRVLDRDYRLPLRQSELAKQWGVSDRTLLRRFRRATGYAPSQYLQAVRLERARELLESTNESLQRITDRVGYEDVSSFRRLFKESIGLSPAEYRKRFRHPSSEPQPTPHWVAEKPGNTDSPA
ncbi:MAG: helix-turn-helix domain-containing protein [Gammaproteobacteria bacterium]